MFSAILQAKRIAAAAALKGFIMEPYGAFAQTNTLEEIYTYMKSWTAPIWQYVLFSNVRLGLVQTNRNFRLT